MIDPSSCSDACPRFAASSGRFDFPVGQVRRVASMEPEVDETKRNLLKLAAVAGVLGVGGGAAGGALQYVQPPAVGISSYPRTQLIDVDGAPLTTEKIYQEYNVTTSELYLFNYPLRNEPNFLLNLFPPLVAGSPTFAPVEGVNMDIPGGIGTPNPTQPWKKSIVAYSAICQHLGCPAPALAYYPLIVKGSTQVRTCTNPGSNPGGRDFYIHCSCHGSTYDVSDQAKNLTGPAVLPLPQVVLEEDADHHIFATGMTASSPPVNGHIDTLQGDYGVGSSAQLQKETPVILCNFPT